MVERAYQNPQILYAVFRCQFHNQMKLYGENTAASRVARQLLTLYLKGNETEPSDRLNSCKRNL